MASRLKLGEEKKVPDLNFKLKFFVTFSISSKRKLSIDFSTFCGNDDETKSQKLRKIIFDKLGVKDQKEFDKMFIEESNYVKNKIKEKIKQKNNFQGMNWFSTMMTDEISEEMTKNGK